MKKKIVKGKEVYEIDSKTCEEMFEVQEEVRKNTFPKAGGYCASVLTKKGNIDPGVAYQSDTYTLTIHGEASALNHAAIHGEGKEIVAITGPNCHICKQLIYENSLRSNIDIVVVVNEDGQFKQIPISGLMPFPWPSEPQV
ncbi:hypothetical protein C4577_06940 [Candidatus Parcubacteria bacterium]|nr:MAG: hypothetical protein C4577_06940 [Candidatus Parcubacteria bacterium]